MLNFKHGETSCIVDFFSYHFKFYLSIFSVCYISWRLNQELLAAHIVNIIREIHKLECARVTPESQHAYCDSVVWTNYNPGVSRSKPKELFYTYTYYNFEKFFATLDPSISHDCGYTRRCHQFLLSHVIYTYFKKLLSYGNQVSLSTFISKDYSISKLFKHCLFFPNYRLF